MFDEEESAFDEEESASEEEASDEEDTTSDGEELTPMLSDESISYLVLSVDVAAVRSCNNRASILRPRDSIPFHGKLVRATLFSLIDVPDSVDTVLIPRSIRWIVLLFSVTDLARAQWCLSSGANWSGSVRQLSMSVIFNVFLFLNLWLLLVIGRLPLAGLSVVFILIVIHRSGN
jgi:hypothetical protein